jgi:hypothetical protein
MYEVARAAFADVVWRPVTTQDGVDRSVEPFESLTADELFATTNVKAEDGSSGLRAQYEIRQRGIRFPEMSIVGVLTPRMWLTKLEVAFMERLKQLETEQPTFRWVLAAVVLKQEHTGKVRVSPASLGRVMFPSMEKAIELSSESGDGGSQKNKAVKVGPPARVSDEKALQLHIHFLFVDISRSKPQDPNEGNPDYSGVETPAGRYAKSRLMSHMHTSLMKERQRGEELMRLAEAAEASELEESRPRSPLELVSVEVVKSLLANSTPTAVAAMFPGATPEQVLVKCGMEVPEALRDRKTSKK